MHGGGPQGTDPKVLADDSILGVCLSEKRMPATGRQGLKASRNVIPSIGRAPNSYGKWRHSRQLLSLVADSTIPIDLRPNGSIKAACRKGTRMTKAMEDRGPPRFQLTIRLPEGIGAL